jgi:hypothetical protein
MPLARTARVKGPSSRLRKPFLALYDGDGFRVSWENCDSDFHKKYALVQSATATQAFPSGSGALWCGQLSQEQSP